MKVKFTFEIGIVHKDSMALMGHHSIISTFGLQEIINEPTHIIGDSSSCIDLIFISQPNLVMESGVHSSLHPNCHH